MTVRRVVFVETYPHVYGGAQLITHLLAKHLPSRGFEAEVVTTGPGPFVARLLEDDIPVTQLSVPSSLRYYGHRTRGWRAGRAAIDLPVVWARLARLLRTRADLAHINDYRAMLLALPASRLVAVPSIWHIHSAEDPRTLNRFGSLLATRTVVPSETARTELIRKGLSANPRRVEVVRNCVPPAALAAPGGAQGDKPLVVCVARLSPEKGLDILLGAAARLQDRIAGLRIMIYGAAPEGRQAHERELEELHRRLGLNGTVTFAGHVDQPYLHWGRPALYVQPSRAETSGLAALEAMAVGVPVVASRVGGLTDVVESGVNGELVAPDDPGALSVAIERLLMDYDRLARMGSRARAGVLQHYTVETMVERVAALYGEVFR